MAEAMTINGLAIGGPDLDVQKTASRFDLLQRVWSGLAVICSGGGL